MVRVLLITLMVLIAPPALATGEGPGADVPEMPVLIVDRRPESIALFLSMPATQLSPVFGQGADALLDAEGTVDIDGLYEGTFELADQIFAGVEAHANDAPVTFEALSMMVHDPDVLPEFRTPWDGETSIAVCTSPDTVDKMGLETLQAYLGYFAWKLNGLSTLALTFPSGDGLGEIEVREFWNMQPTGAYLTRADAAGTLVLEPKSGAVLGTATLWLLAGGLAAIGLVFVGLYLKQGASGPMRGES